MEVLTPEPIPVLKQTVCLVWQELESALYFDTKQCLVMPSELLLEMYRGTFLHKSVSPWVTISSRNL